MRAARQFCKQDTFFGCSPFENGMDAVWSPGSYWPLGSITSCSKHWFRLYIYRNNPSTDIRTVDLDFTPTHQHTLQNTVFEIDTALSDT